MEIIGKPARDTSRSPQRLLERVGLGGFENSYPHEMSGDVGRQSDLAVLLADESFGHLDEVTRGSSGWNSASSPRKAARRSCP